MSSSRRMAPRRRRCERRRGEPLLVDDASAGAFHPTRCRWRTRGSLCHPRDDQDHPPTIPPHSRASSGSVASKGAGREVRAHRDGRRGRGRWVRSRPARRRLDAAGSRWEVDEDDEHASEQQSRREHATAHRRIQIRREERGRSCGSADHRHVPGVELQHLAPAEVLDEHILLRRRHDDVVGQTDPDPAEVARRVEHHRFGHGRACPAPGSTIPRGLRDR